LAGPVELGTLEVEVVDDTFVLLELVVTRTDVEDVVVLTELDTSVDDFDVEVEVVDDTFVLLELVEIFTEVEELVDLIEVVELDTMVV
jgi:hypothetical protein